MRVALVGDYPVDPTRIWGGVEAAFAYLVSELGRVEGLEVHILTLDRAARLPSQRLPEIPGVKLHLLPPFPRLELARNFRTYQRCLDNALAVLRPDVVHAQGATDHAYVALRSHYPTVITVHGVQAEDGKHQGKLRERLRKRLYALLIERYNLSHTRHLIAIGRYVRDYFARVLRPDVQVYDIPNAVDERFFDLAGRPREQPATGPIVLFAGRVVVRKRPLDLVRAFARIAGEFPGAQLRLAGEYRSDPDYADAVHAFVRQERLEDSVRLLGGLSEDETLSEFAACDVLALPAAQETTPMVIAQAMAAGKPVLATPVGGVAEMVHDGETGLLAPVGNVEQLARALRMLLEDPGLRSRMGQAGRRFALGRYRAETVAARTHEVYARVAAAEA